MCIIAVCNDRKLNDDELFACWQNNNDGAGMAWFDGKKHVIKKGYMEYDEFTNAYSLITVLPHVVHFRIATAGGVIPELTHPFICNRKSPLSLEWIGKEPVLFHNGIVTNWHVIANMMGIQTPNNFWSDTRVIASILSQWDLDFLKEEGGKYAVLVEEEIKVYGKFIEENGILFSNDGYEEAWSTWYYSQYGTNWGNQWGGTYPKRDSYKGQYSRSYSYGNLVTNICNSCKDGNSNICNYCSEKDNSPWLKTTMIKECKECFATEADHNICFGCYMKESSPYLHPYNHCDYCAHYPGSKSCDYCPNAPAEEAEVTTVGENDDGHIAFSKCDGNCNSCEQYDAIHNTCKEVVLAMEERKTALILLEHKIEAELAREIEYEECADKGDGCYTCASFDTEELKCSLWD